MRSGPEHRTAIAPPVRRALLYLALSSVVLAAAYVAIRWTSELVIDIAEQLHR